MPYLSVTVEWVGTGESPNSSKIGQTCVVVCSHITIYTIDREI